jgi:hypothetical protein
VIDRVGSADASTAVARRRHRRAAAALIAVAAAVVVSQWVRVIARPEGDFYLHWIFGVRARLGLFLYAGRMHCPYPPSWSIVGLPMSFLPFPVARGLLYPLGLLPLAGLMLMLSRMAGPTRGPQVNADAPRRDRFWTWALALGLSSRFLVRELPENGTNLMVLALSWLGVFLWCRGRDRSGAVSLGLAIALKCTPALFLAYFAWKRQYRMAAMTALAAASFLVLPASWMGREAYAHSVQSWVETVRAGLSEPDPTRGVLGDEEPYNLSLRPAIGRYLVHLAPEHRGYPWRLDALDLRPEVAGRVVKVMTLALLAAVALAMGRSIDRRDGDGVMIVAWEASAVSVLMLLLSPITWRQHGVAVLPACYLVARSWRSGVLTPALKRLIVLAYVVPVLALDRGLIGQGLTLRLDSLGITAWAWLALLTVVMVSRSRVVAAAASSPRMPDGLRVDAAARPAPASSHVSPSSPRPVREIRP